MGYFKAALVRATASILCTLLLLSAAHARADERSPKSFDIQPQDLAAALSEFARQSHEEILFAPDIVAEKRSGGVRGTMQPFAALKILLSDSGLPFTSTPSGAILIGQAGAPTALSAAQGRDSSQKEGKKSSSQDFRVAQVDQGAPEPKAVGYDQNLDRKKKEEGLSEIIVTAQKKSERLQDVPVPVTAINADVLVSNNEIRLQDYYSKVPGLNLELDGQTGVPTLSIRGITTGGQTNPTVGVTVDDVPYGSSTFIGGGFVSPDIDPSDLARVEVLRGPQGTLYGVSSIGGLLKYVTLDPSTDAVSGFLQAGTSDVSHGAQPGYSLRGAVNVPLSDTFAVRASVFTRLDPGYVDNIQTGERGVNWGTTDGAHLSALWHPSQDFSIKLSALLQENNVHGSPLVDSSLGSESWDQSFLRGTGGYEQRFQAYSANIHAKLGVFDLTAVSGYGVNTSSLSYDVTPLYGTYTEASFGVTGSPYFNDLKTSKFSQELRLSAPIGPNLEWLVGAFYTHEDSSYISNVLAEAPSGAIVGQGLYYSNPSTYEEYAAFTDVTYHITDQFDVQFGGRESQIKQSSSAVGSGPLNGGDSVTPNADSKDNAFTYLVTPRLKLSPDVMLYARFASGYRAGGPNANALVNNTPLKYDPDKTQNYDLGVKADFLEHRLSIDAALYYIDWKNVQVTVQAPCGCAVYITNGGGAKSEGAELSIESKPLTGLTVAAWVAWNEAVLTKDFPPASSAYGLAGYRLPYSSRFSGNLSADQDLVVNRVWTAFVGGSVSFVGDRLGLFQSTPTRQVYPSYAKTDLHAGAKHDTWTVNVYADNLTNRRTPLQGGLDGPNTYANSHSFIYLQPRTVGLSVSDKF
jgi:iron complex outermembrane recepter protein